MKKLLLVVVGFGMLFAAGQPTLAEETNELLFADFDGDAWGNWKATGDAFGPGPAHGALPGQQPVTGFVGRGFASSFVGGDKSTGTLTSVEFTITRPYLNFLIGGGNHPGEASMDLLIDGRVAYSATGIESERLSWHTWQLFPVLNQKGRLQIVDGHTGGRGHVSVDQITLSDRPKVIPYANDPITSAMASLAEATSRAEQDATRPVYHFLAP